MWMHTETTGMKGKFILCLCDMIAETTEGMIFPLIQKKWNTDLWGGLDAEISPVKEPKKSKTWTDSK